MAPTRETRKGKLEKIESLAAAKVPRSSYISTRPCDALRKPSCNRIIGRNCDDRNGPCCIVYGQHAGGRAGQNDIRVESDQFARKRRHALGDSVAMAQCQRHIATFHVSEVAQRGSKRRDIAARRHG